MQAITGFVYGYVKGLAKEHLYNETLGIAQQMLTADSLSDAAEVFIGAAAAGGESFWLDMLIIAGVLVIVVVVMSCVVRFSWWFCVGIPRAAIDVERIRAGTKGYQIEAAQERAARKRRVEKGEEEAFVPAEQDLQQVSEALAKLRKEQGGGGAAGKGKAKEPAPATAKAAEFTATSRRTPQDARATPASVLRGFPEVDFLLTSPGQRYLLVGCRSKRKTSLYPQSDAAAFMGRGKELQEKYFTDVNALVTTAVGLEQKAEIYAAQFSIDDARLIVGERFTDKFVCFTLSGRTNVSLTQLWSMKLPNHRLVSSVPRWSVLGQDGILSILDQTTEVEVITRGTAETSSAHKDKFKVGSALAWAIADDRIALGGSFLREPRLSKVVQRPGGISLEPLAVLPNPQKLRVTALAFVVPGAPEFNTRSYVIVLLESGTGTLYDVQSLSTQNTPQAVCTFSDTDYAEHRSDAPVRILTAVRGQAYHEVVRIALLRGPSVTVYEQSGKADSSSFQMVRIADVYDVQEGDAVRNAVFLQNGLGLATSGLSDNRHVRMFALPPPGKTA